MRTLEITTSLPCINNCKICPQDKLKINYTGTQRMSFLDFTKLMKTVPKDVRIDFSGFSEPFWNVASSEMMKWAFESGYKVALFTTLIGFSISDVRTLMGVKFEQLVLHIPDDINFVLENGPCTLTSWLEMLYLLKNNHKIDASYYHVGEISPEIRAVLPDAIKHGALTRANNVDSLPSIPRKQGNIGCGQSQNRFDQNVVLPNGDVYLCCMDWSLKHKLGNLFTDDYSSLHKSEGFQRVQAAMTNENMESICRYCVR